MKTERRHELQTNWLADRVGEIIVVLKPYGKGLTGGLLAVLVVWAAFVIMAHRSHAEEASNWNKLWDGLLLGGPKGNEVLVPLAETNPKQPSGEWALLVLADDDLEIGVSTLFTEKAVGRGRIHNALDNYKSVLQNSTDPLVREHALYGVGLAQESLGNLTDAETAYKQVRTDYPTGSYSSRAQERLDDLARDSTKSRYDWLKTLEPPSSGLSKGSDKTSGTSGPQLPSELEPFSDFAKPNSKTPPPEPKPDTSAATPKTPATGDVKTGDTKAPESKAPESKAPEKTVPATKAPENKTPDAKAPDKAPDNKTSGKADEKSPAAAKPADSKS